VKLAAQTLSESVVVALKQLHDNGHSEFSGCSIATAKFCRIINNTFDCLNSRSLYSNKFKKPLSESNMKEVFTFFDESIEYLLSIKFNINDKPVIQTKSKTGFLGFIIDMKNLKVIYSDYITKGYIKYILTYKLSQDHLEMFFSCIRAMGGYNNNPNVKQFMASYKRLLHHTEVQSSSQGNCISLDNTSILNVSSRQKSNINAEKEDEGTQGDIEDILTIDDLPLSQNNAANNDAIIYIAGYVERHFRFLKM
ncbi:THAP domain-containing protein, partial [Ooceraea biroi]